MGFLRRLLGQSEPATWPPPGPITAWPTAETNLSAHLTICTPDPTSHTVEVVGESHYQEALERLAGGRTVDGARNPDGLALLLPEPTNPYDPNAVRVVYVAGGKGATIGYLSRDVDSIAYRPVIDELAKRGQVLACPARVIGGWDNGNGDRGSFGVRLSLDTPRTLLRELGVELPPEEPRVRNYATTVCPYCSIGLDPLPKAKKKCPGCGQPIYVRSGPDGFTYLLQEVDLPVLEEAWGEYHYKQREAEYREALRDERELSRR